MNSVFNKCLWSHYPPAKLRGHQTHADKGFAQAAYPPHPLTIRLHEDGKIVEGLTIDDVLPGARDVTVVPRDCRRDALGNLVTPGGVHFLTRTGKHWFLKFQEFQFIINRRKPLVPPKPEQEPEPIALKEAA